MQILVTVGCRVPVSPVVQSKWGRIFLTALTRWVLLFLHFADLVPHESVERQRGTVLAHVVGRQSFREPPEVPRS